MKTRILTTNNFLAPLLCVIASLLISTACSPTGEDKTAVGQAENTANTSWAASLDISGGFAGLMQNIAIDQSGKAIFINKKTNSRVEQRIPPNVLREYAKLVEGLPLVKPDTRPFNQCRDCISYTLLTDFNGTKQHTTIDDTEMQNSAAKVLIQKLTALASKMAGK